MTAEAVIPDIDEDLDEYIDETPVDPNELRFEQAAVDLAQALLAETALARVGALPDLAAAAVAKREAFDALQQARAALDGPPPAALPVLLALIEAADENALVLEAVGATLEHTARRLRQLLSARSDPGIYNAKGKATGSPKGRTPRHLLAARLDAQV